MSNSSLKKHQDQLDFPVENGEFVRWESQFRNWITPDGSAGVTGRDGFKAETGRYHLYVSYACPWAHRTLIYRAIKNLESIISVSVVNPKMGSASWDFKPYSGAGDDDIYQSEFLHEVYKMAAKNFDGVVTVPVLWDKKQKMIVNNESSEIIRMLNNAFNEFTDLNDDYYPESLRPAIDEINSLVYDSINNGVYKAGFARSQPAYEKAHDKLFAALEVGWRIKTI